MVTVCCSIMAVTLSIGAPVIPRAVAAPAAITMPFNDVTLSVAQVTWAVAKFISMATAQVVTTL